MHDLHLMDEPELKKLCMETLSPHFRIVSGDHPDSPECVNFYSGKSLRPDFICYPLKPLRDSGWPDWMFYIEVKDCKGGNGASRMHEMAWQAKTYQDCACLFRLPAFTLVFPDFQTVLNSSPTCAARKTDYADWFSGYMQKERVGELFIYNPDNWKIKFSSSVLYDHGDKRKNFQLLDRKHRGVCQ